MDPTRIVRVAHRSMTCQCQSHPCTNHPESPTKPTTEGNRNLSAVGILFYFVKMVNHHQNHHLGLVILSKSYSNPRLPWQKRYRFVPGRREVFFVWKCFILRGKSLVVNEMMRLPQQTLRITLIILVVRCK